MAEKKRIRIYEDDKGRIHDEKRFGEDYAETVNRLLNELDDHRETAAQPAD